LFCGAGGLSEGFKQAGFRIVSGIDSDYYSIQTFVRNHIGAVGICKDIQKITLRDIHKTLNDNTFDGIIGSPPCQGFTTIAMPKLRSLGVLRTTEIPRNGLYRQFVRLVKLLRPKFFVMENVKGMLTIENGKIPPLSASNFNRIEGKTICWVKFTRHNL
jgi:DNA (cytosine-5)-methyltransferase 1